MVYAKPNKVSWYRIKQGKTSAQLAKLSGLPDGYIRKVEQGYIPNDENKIKIADALDMTVEELFSEDEDF